ncbi:hypothetical protein DPMN_152102 [Dreissena polymorpha]|uniref:Uncharacterized protein n=1 Tax=Dreissena polymorpha TaxID=45954 RepID=A0A9D4J812_DREPO|nr:hypothetical protein DPMN_152102 [Dreissena polymorpha]
MISPFPQAQECPCPAAYTPRQRLKWDHDFPLPAGTGVPLPSGVHTDRCILAVSDQYVSCIFKIPSH